MSTESRLLIEFADILGVRIECKCGAAIVDSPGVERTPSTYPVRCGACREPILAEGDETEIRTLQRILAELKKRKLKLRLEIKTP